MKALLLSLLALGLAEWFIGQPSVRRSGPHRTPEAAKAWKDWYTLHPNGGGV